MKPDVGSEFGSLCSPMVPFTDYLFGEDLQKHLKDIGDENKQEPNSREVQRQTTHLPLALVLGEPLTTRTGQKTSPAWVSNTPARSILTKGASFELPTKAVEQPNS